MTPEVIAMRLSSAARVALRGPLQFGTAIECDAARELDRYGLIKRTIVRRKTRVNGTARRTPLGRFVLRILEANRSATAQVAGGSEGGEQ